MTIKDLVSRPSGNKNFASRFNHRVSCNNSLVKYATILKYLFKLGKSWGYFFSKYLGGKRYSNVQFNTGYPVITINKSFIYIHMNHQWYLNFLTVSISCSLLSFFSMVRCADCFLLSYILVPAASSIIDKI